MAVQIEVAFSVVAKDERVGAAYVQHPDHHLLFGVKKQTHLRVRLFVFPTDEQDGVFIGHFQGVAQNEALQIEVVAFGNLKFAGQQVHKANFRFTNVFVFFKEVEQLDKEDYR